ncbi:MAG: SDR family NAD(P)-dependent oxidoreductase [Ignavibacteria bacterium]|nr:SDR family NAD(P)-dependent oxidoreductase [Ignavibacteria bacterium]
MIIFTEKKRRKQLEEYLKKEKQSYTFVTGADSFKKISDTEFTINHSLKDNFGKLFKEISSKVTDELKIISFHSGKKISDKISDEVLQHSGCILILNIIQAISKAKFLKSPQLSIVTENALAINDRDDVSGLISSSLWGMGKVVSLEHPELKCKLIDTDSETGSEYLFKEINSSTGEDQIAFRNNERLAARLIRSKSRQDKIIPIDDKSTYLITGGLGGLGILTAKWLADKGARHLALISRSNNTDPVIDHLDELRSMKAEVRTYKADVTNRDELKTIIEDIRRSGYPLKGIIHSAGVLDDGVILNQSPEKFEKVTGPKVEGAMHLHELTKKDSIDFFVMYSSIASVLGSAGQANHSAANAFLDSLAHYRRHLDLPALSINWGVWSEIGSAAAKGADNQEKIAGIKSINPKQGMSALEKAMMTDTAQIGVMIMDWYKYSGSN